MSTWRGYVGVENLALGAEQRATLVAHLRSLGPAEHVQPSHLCHWRIRLDEQAAIFEAEFDSATVTAAAIGARLEQIYKIAAGSVTWSTATTTYGPVVTYRYAGTNYLRLIAFGGVEPEPRRGTGIPGRQQSGVGNGRSVDKGLPRMCRMDLDRLIIPFGAVALSIIAARE